MNLRESIKDIPDDDWLDLTEELRANYKVFMGRCPKKCITGEVLDYEVLTIGDIRYQEDYTLHKFLVKDNWRPKEVSQ